MKISAFALLIAVFVSSAVTSAQGYAIRLTYNTNLRAANSLTSGIVATAPAGSILQVLGQQGRWLQIDRNGNQVWMAGWVSYSRVESTQPAVSPPQTPIDNCCFVDRQCHSDQDWTDGYWAFQNGQCRAPAQTQVPASSQPVAVDSSRVDNCCFLDWRCQSDDDWRRGFQAYQNNQCKHPGVKIEGSETFVVLVETGLDLLKEKAPHWYDYVISGLDQIKEDHTTRIPWAWSRSRTTTYPAHLVELSERRIHYMAGLLAHEACHIHLYEAGLFQDVQWIEERECSKVELEAYLAVDPTDRFGLAEHERYIIANIENPEIWWWD